ncbi:acyl-coenzyme A thioesterase 1-like [Macrobrachium nipponense]|uniref:acyl-coenzyme A thioesterase 1-like n=1 Tax=Macrobrachium nipponense TaxID=159736 RepID=UPI0030C7FA93
MNTTSKEDVLLSVIPLSCLQDEPIHIKVSGLKPNQDVTLKASMIEDRGVPYMSYAHYRADENGAVDVDKMESLGGQYEGIFPMGLIGSLVPAPPHYRYVRFIKRVVEKPLAVTISVHNGHLSAEKLCSSEVTEPHSCVAHERHYMASGVQRIPVQYGEVRGTLFLPPDLYLISFAGDGPFPAVIDMFGTLGGLIEYRSAQLASRGIASFALAIFNYDDLPKVIKEFNIAYFEEAVQFLLQHEKVLDFGIGVIGNSKAGDLAVSLATFIPSVAACVAVNNFIAPASYGMRVKDRFYPPFHYDVSLGRFTDDGYECVQSCIPEKKFLQKLMLPLEESSTAFLFIVSAVDRDVNSEVQAQSARQRLSSHNYKQDYKVESYPGAGHLFDPPYSPHCFASFEHGIMSSVCWGGTAKFQTMAQVKAWKEIQRFFLFHLKEKWQFSSDTKSPTMPWKSQL